jgi:hypothetical protein
VAHAAWDRTQTATVRDCQATPVGAGNVSHITHPSGCGVRAPLGPPVLVEGCLFVRWAWTTSSSEVRGSTMPSGIRRSTHRECPSLLYLKNTYLTRSKASFLQGIPAVCAKTRGTCGEFPEPEAGVNVLRLCSVDNGSVCEVRSKEEETAYPGHEQARNRRSLKCAHGAWICQTRNGEGKPLTSVFGKTSRCCEHTSAGSRSRPSGRSVLSELPSAGVKILAHRERAKERKGILWATTPQGVAVVGYRESAC